MIRGHCSNPQLQLVRLFHRVLFCWITGNGDMHLKNWSLVDYFGHEICSLNDRMIDRTLKQLTSIDWNSFILNSKLLVSDKRKELADSIVTVADREIRPT